MPIETLVLLHLICIRERLRQSHLFQMFRSNSRDVTLVDVERETAGVFKCEVTSDAPLFHTQIGFAKLLVAGN